MKSEIELIKDIIWSCLTQCEWEYSLSHGGNSDPDRDFTIGLIQDGTFRVEAIPDGKHPGKVYEIIVAEVIDYEPDNAPVNKDTSFEEWWGRSNWPTDFTDTRLQKDIERLSRAAWDAGRQVGLDINY